MEPEPTPPSPPAAWRAQLDALRSHALAPSPPPREEGRLALVRYGLAQPFLGLRTLFGASELLGIALAPAIGVLLLSGVVAWRTAHERGTLEGVAAFLLTVAALAPLPALLFGRVYAHLAAKARPSLGLPPAGAYLRSVPTLVNEWVRQVIVLAIGVLPYVILARALPLVGGLVGVVLQAAWAGHWIVVEGYDNARTLPPGRTVEELEEQARAVPGHPWYDRWRHGLHGPRLLIRLLLPLRAVSKIVTRLSRPWRVEVDLVEREPWISLGFGLGAAVMLAVPGLNLLLRPAVVVAGVHLRQRLGVDEPAGASASRPGTQPYPTLSSG